MNHLRFLSAPAIAVMAFALVLAGCGRVPERQWERGDFHPDPGRRWDLPGDLSVNSILGWEDEIENSLLPLALAVRNSGGARRSVTMPAGLCFKPRDPDYQYMILLQDFTFSVPVDDTTVLLPTWCANEDLDEPDDESFYNIDLQAWDQDLKELYDLLRGKVIRDSFVDLDMLQDALWEITDGVGLTDSTRTWLRELPE
ncbi:MAG: hypothetical protein R6X14_05555 [bacterium]